MKSAKEKARTIQNIPPACFSAKFLWGNPLLSGKQASLKKNKNMAQRGRIVFCAGYLYISVHPPDSVPIGPD